MSVPNIKFAYGIVTCNHCCDLQCKYRVTDIINNVSSWCCDIITYGTSHHSFYKEKKRELDSHHGQL